MLNREKTKAKSFKQVQDFADTRFKRMLEFIVTRIRIEYAKPEEKIIKQDEVRDENEIDCSAKEDYD